MIWTFVVVCWGFACPANGGVWMTPIEYETPADCEDAAIRRTELLGALYPMRLVDVPLEMPIPDHIFRYICAKG